MRLTIIKKEIQINYEHIFRMLVKMKEKYLKS